MKTYRVRCGAYALESFRKYRLYWLPLVFFFSGKEATRDAEDKGFDPELGRS